MAETTNRHDGKGGPESWHEQLRRGGLELAILLSLTRESRYGLEIIRHLEQFTDLVVTEGTIYPILARLSRDGLVAADWRETGAHPRKYYQLTSRGRERLGEMVASWKSFTAKLDRLMSAAEENGHETH
jgi:PadR family transcriptional regulator, regulatory protein PadR